MDVCDAKRLKALEAENTRLKKLLAEAMLEREVTREVLRKSGDRTGSSRGGADHYRAGAFGTPRPADRGHECRKPALPASPGPQWGAA